MKPTVNKGEKTPSDLVELRKAWNDFVEEVRVSRSPYSSTAMVVLANLRDKIDTTLRNGTELLKVKSEAKE